MIHLGDFRPDETVYLPLEFVPESWTLDEDGHALMFATDRIEALEAFGLAIPCQDTMVGRQYALSVKGKKPGGKATQSELALFTVGRTPIPEPFPEVVNAQVVGFQGEELQMHKGRPMVHAKSYEAFPKGQISNESLAPEAITGAKIGQNAFGPHQLGEQTVEILKQAVAGAFDTDPAGRVRIVSGTGAGEINLEHGAIKRVMQNDDTPPKPPDLAPLIQALDDVKAALAKVATTKQLDAIPRVKVDDIVTNGPIHTVAGQVAQVARVNEVDVVTGSVQRVAGDVQGDVQGSVKAVRGNVHGSVESIGEMAQQQIEELVNSLMAHERRHEPGKGAPPDDASWGEKIDYLYKAWRNKTATTPQHEVLFNTDGATIDQTLNLYQREGVTYRDTVDVGKPDALKPKK